MENKKFSFYTNISAEDALADLNSSLSGLTQSIAEKRLHECGPNEIKEVDVTWWHILKSQILSPFMLVFLVIGLAYGLTHQFAEAVIVAIIILINVGIGFFQEYRSNSAMQALKKCLMSEVTVKRDSTEMNIPLNQLVPGDIIILYVGDVIPADCRFIEVDNLAVDESSMTGESVAVAKKVEPMQEAAVDAYKAENIGFTGSTVTQGKGKAVVIATGAATALGKIAALTNKTVNESSLEKGSLSITRLTIYLVFASLLIMALIHIVMRGGEFSFIDFFLFAAALTITAIPEGLPMVITFCLSQGASALKKNNVIVKRLSAIGDLGSIEVFCTDKTGTLTENALSVQDIYGKNPDATLLYAVVSSPAQAVTKDSMTKGFDLALQKKLTDVHNAELAQYTMLKESPFTPQKRQSMALVHKNGIHTVILKGSPEVVIEKCTFLSEDEKKSIQSWIETEEHKGNRILAIATKNIASYNPDSYDIEADDQGYETVGLIGFQDPLKETALTTVQKAKELGIQIKILSGDSKNVCYTIAKQLGLEENPDNIVLGEDFEKASEEEKDFLANNRSVFARVNPEQKYAIIGHLKKKYAVGYMGDGINDAPALKMAHVSFAVNDAAPVAREAAEIILLRKSLRSVVLGIEEGRRTIVNTLKYTKMTNAPSFGHFYALAVASLLVSYPPMLPMQLLFLNLLTDLPMMAISTDNVSPEEVQKPLTYDMVDAAILITLFGLIMFIADMTIFLVFRSHFPETLQTSWFITSTISEVIFIFLFRTQLLFFTAHRPSTTMVGLSLFVIVTAVILPCTAFGNKIFSFTTPEWQHLPWLIGVVVFNLVVAEGVKLTYYYVKKRYAKN
ncbi:MAG TPA: HAD-IC family P-type ATPase [Candidatus Babeliales bacterium]|jgi:Mg2+-importing ATPase|nr:HAD-IC family P-type ATPase [Candidatus Babeliales bacterium]